MVNEISGGWITVWLIYHHTGVSSIGGTKKWMVFKVPLFQETSIDLLFMVAMNPLVNMVYDGLW
jgi:hypothetical protein